MGSFRFFGIDRSSMFPVDIQWQPAPLNDRLTPDCVHVWAALLDVLEDQVLAFERTLSEDERQRAARFHFPQDRRRFVAGRGILRAILGSYLDLEAAAVRFTYGRYGKPSLVELPGQQTVHFNLAHTKELLVVAATSSCEVGVDIERIRAMPDSSTIIQHFFSPREATQLETLETERQRLSAFFSLWTCKEAFAKATGSGLTERLAEFSLARSPGDPPHIVAGSGDLAPAADWTVTELRPAKDFRGALAVPRKDLRICFRQLPTTRSYA